MMYAFLLPQYAFWLINVTVRLSWFFMGHNIIDSCFHSNRLSSLYRLFTSDRYLPFWLQLFSIMRLDGYHLSDWAWSLCRYLFKLCWPSYKQDTGHIIWNYTRYPVWKLEWFHWHDLDFFLYIKNYNYVHGVTTRISCAVWSVLTNYYAVRSNIYRLQAAKVTDERVKVMNEVITGIRVIKMYGWEDAFHRMVAKIRQWVWLCAL